MADSTINELPAVSTLKDQDLTIFDILNINTREYYTSKITFSDFKAIFANINDAKYIPFSGGQLLPNAYISAAQEDPISSLNLVTKSYVDKQKLVNVLFLSGGNMTGSLILSGYPRTYNEAANKQYVDDEIAILRNTVPNGSLYVKLAGDTMVGSLILSGYPRTYNEAANKQYVDDQVLNVRSIVPNAGLFVAKSGDSMTGSLYLTGAPTMTLESANKGYVDAQTTLVRNLIPDVSGVLYKSGGTMTGRLFLYADPNLDTEAANKRYVDYKFGLITVPDVSGYLSKSGGTMTGTLTLNGNPQNPSDAANRAYVDYKFGLITVPDVSGLLSKSGGTMTGPLTLNGLPQSPSSAASKAYVDNTISLLNIPDSNSFVKIAGDTMTGNLSLKSFSEKFTTLTNATGNVSLDLNNSNSFHITLGGNVTNFNVTTPTNMPQNDSYTFNVVLKQKSAAAFATVTFNINSVKVIWHQGTAPTMTATANAVDFYTFTYINGSWYGFIGGQAFA